MIVFPHCKINLGLHILSKREDGYHNIESLFFPLPLKDVVEIIHNKKQVSPSFHFSHSGWPIDGPENLCRKTYRLLQNDFPSLPAMDCHLHKNIPIGAGLGGGSANAAFTLQLLNQLAGLQLTDTALQSYAAKLGSDCTFFLQNQPCIVKGKGEILQPVSFSLKGYKIMLVYPGISIPTAEAYADVKMRVHKKTIEAILALPMKDWQEFLQNDFEMSVFARYPAIAGIQKELYRQKAVYASLSGSGSTVFGIFEKDKTVQLSFPKNYFIREFIFNR